MTLMDSDIDMNNDFEENSLYQEGIISESYQRVDNSYIQEPPELVNLVDTGRLIEYSCQNRWLSTKFWKLYKERY